jgi:hypothetical protein
MRPPPISTLPPFRCATSLRCKAVLARIICSISCIDVFMLRDFPEGLNILLTRKDARFGRRSFLVYPLGL